MGLKEFLSFLHSGKTLTSLSQFESIYLTHIITSNGYFDVINAQEECVIAAIVHPRLFFMTLIVSYKPFEQLHGNLAEIAKFLTLYNRDSRLFATQYPRNHSQKKKA